MKVYKVSSLIVEVFNGIGDIEPMLFYQYKVTGKGMYDNVYKILFVCFSFNVIINLRNNNNLNKRKIKM